MTENPPIPTSIYSQKPRISQLRDILTVLYEFRYNVLTGIYQYRQNLSDGRYHDLTDREFNSMYCRIKEEFISDLGEKLLRSVIESDFSCEYDQIKEYFTALPTWNPEDGDHIKTLADLVTVKAGQEERWILYLRRWLMAHTATMLGKSINHSCLVLLGPQGIGKSTFLNKLNIASDLIFCGFLDPRNKDSIIAASENTLINLDELESSTREDWSFIKSLITMQQIKARRPWGRRAEVLPRRASFVASANDPQILGDLTGSRRWLCVEIEKVDYLAVTPELMRQVYAQANTLLESGEKYWFDGDEITAINEANSEYNAISPEEEIMNKMFGPSAPGFSSPIKLTTTEIMQEMNKAYPDVKFNTKKIGMALRNSGAQRIKSDGVYKYIVFREDDAPMYTYNRDGDHEDMRV